ncbi:SGNH/GDSL hydrolase family protein [Enterococcus casseliflavus]|uniref:SGNH/GDSL hydrolase family protein n=1 Tax=Enterococcus casseliflavus TaxID=37734 RepID=UPI00032F036C|nr:SGNH/GDSL hydrolase family protein [Enterococcus casseliflavus]EOH85495.1 hypothetical protein UAM_00103 [Enterococcus casseliflavus ATCC 49996]EOU10179.1 hypothetical protein I582_00690 [Enterococcus casseliflavus ATCC 49996]QQB84096.1 SGNH/GDSL hydrolase family protein [Enterococcus casseliflavus]
MELDQFRDVDLVIDRANDSFVQKQFVSQGDYKGRTLTVQVTNNGNVGEVPGLTLNLNWHNEASGLTDLTAFDEINKANSIFSIEYPQRMMTPGKVFASIQIIQNGKVINLKQFELTVQRLAGQPVGIVEKAEFSALVAALADSNRFRTDIDSLDTTKADKTDLALTDSKVADLDSVKADKVEVNDLFSSVGSGSPKGAFDTLDQLKAKYPNGTAGVFIVKDTNKWYYYNESWLEGGNYLTADYSESRAEKLQKDLSTLVESDAQYKSGRMGNDGVLVTSQYSHYKVVDAAYGDIFIITAKGLLSNTYPYVITDVSGNVLDFRQRADETLTDFELIIPKNASKLYVNSPIDFQIVIKKYVKEDISAMNQYQYIIDSNYKNLFNGAGTFGAATIDATGGIWKTTVTAKNQGLATSPFDSDSIKTVMNVKGIKTVSSIDILFGYLSPGATAWKYKNLGKITSNTFDIDFSFDATYYKIYNNAEQFRFLIQCNDESPSGYFRLENPTIYALTEFQTKATYDKNLDVMLEKLSSKADELNDSVQTIANAVPTLTDSNGVKYIMTVENGEVKLKRTVPEKVLFMGNSLLLGLDTDGSRGGAFGMCASDYQHDYAYIVEQEILTKNSNATFTKLHDAAFEQAETASAAQTYISSNANSFTSDLDLVILQIGDNVNSDVRRSVFEAALPDLINTIKSKSPAARILLVGSWFDSSNLITNILASVANQTGVEYISIRGLYTSQNMGTVGSIITYKDGSTKETPASYASHPGNLGMQAIAEAIISKIGV